MPYVACLDVIYRSAREQNIDTEPGALANASGLSERVIRKALSGYPLSTRTWEALTRAFGPDATAPAETPYQHPQVTSEEQARAAEIARYEQRLAARPPLTPEQHEAEVDRIAAWNSAVILRKARDAARKDAS